MIKIDDIEINKKYYLTIQTPYHEEEHILRVTILDIHYVHNENLPHYIVFKSVGNSNCTLPEIGYESVSMPLDFIVKAESLHKIMDEKTIYDIIHIIDEYI